MNRLRAWWGDRREMAELRDQAVAAAAGLAAVRLALSLAIDAGVKARGEAEEYRAWWEHAKDERDAARLIARRYSEQLWAAGIDPSRSTS